MRRAFIDKLQCPYCLSSFSVTCALSGDNREVRYGLIKCSCFEFPIVNGVLLLGIVKGYGGAEEAIQPYVPLQVAAILFLRNRDLNGLAKWMQRHTPLVHDLCDANSDYDYVSLAGRWETCLRSEIREYLHQQGKYEVVGASIDVAQECANRLRNWYAGRFVTPRAARLRDELTGLALGLPVLSLCCGQGVAEQNFKGILPGHEIVSIDGQILNLLIVQRFVNPEGSFICHDVQLPLPFEAGFFGLTVSSTCLPEIPSHAFFIKEAVRTTREDGSAVFNMLWASPKARIAPKRYYRFCQNEFESLAAIVTLFHKCSYGRSLGMFRPDPDGQNTWIWDEAQIEQLVKHEGEPPITLCVSNSKNVDTQTRPFGNSTPETQHLHLNPLYRIEANTPTCIRCRRAPEFFDASLVPPGSSYLPETVVIEKNELCTPTYVSGLFHSGVLVSLPSRFGGGAVPLSSLNSSDPRPEN
jgi:SAM-dependent methyltransferase